MISPNEELCYFLITTVLVDFATHERGDEVAHFTFQRKILNQNQQSQKKEKRKLSLKLHFSHS